VSARHNRSVYDASYVALAAHPQIPLVTQDGSMTKGPPVGVGVFLIVMGTRSHATTEPRRGEPHLGRRARQHVAQVAGQGAGDHRDLLGDQILTTGMGESASDFLAQWSPALSAALGGVLLVVGRHPARSQRLRQPLR